METMLENAAQDTKVILRLKNHPMEVAFIKLPLSTGSPQGLLQPLN